MSKLKSHIQSSLDHSVSLSDVHFNKPVVSCEPRFNEPSRYTRGQRKNGKKVAVSKDKEN